MNKALRKLSIFFKSSGLYFAIAVVLWMFAGWVHNYGKKPVEFQMFNFFGIPFWVGVPSLTIILVALGFTFHGLKLVAVDNNTKVDGDKYE